ncbi:MAG: glucosaminidase domain-containing protein [Elsteraceae bacterium]
MSPAAQAPDFGSDPAATRDSVFASILIAATGLFFALLAAIGPFLSDRAAVTVRLPPDPTEAARVVGYQVTVAITEPPRQPFIPRPVERTAPVVAVATIRDEREERPDVNRGGLLAEAGSDHLRPLADRLGATSVAAFDPPSRARDWSADRTDAARVELLRETALFTRSADAIRPALAQDEAPEDRIAGFATDRLRPSELDLWAETEPLEDSKGVRPAAIAADRAEAIVVAQDAAPSKLVVSSDALTPAADESVVAEGRVTTHRVAPAADPLLVERAVALLAEFVDRKATPDRLEAAPAAFAQAEAASPPAKTGDRWSLERSAFALADAGIARGRSDADRNEDESARPALAETAGLGDGPTDALASVAPLEFDPADAVFVTALLPDWSEWDDAVRQNALRERALLRAATWSHAPETPGKLAPTPASSRGLIDLFDRHNFKLGGSTVVPALFIQRLPSDISSVTQAADRKALFLRALLPFVVATNERITRQRERLIDLLPLIEQGLPLGIDDRRFLEQIQADFRVSRPDPEELLRRMDVVPPSLALAQAAEESGWGTSRPAREDNALFGQMVFNEGGMRLREFENLRETVEAYIRNLNTHRAYADFRQKRAQLRRASRPLDSHMLAGHIERYSERGMDYVATIRGLMTANGLRNFDDARLSDIEFLVQATAR